jgi:Sigma-54 interaction domain
MWNASPAVSFMMRAAGPADPVSATSTDWRLSQAADVVAVLRALPRVNLLLIGVDREMWRPLERRLLDLSEPIVEWSPSRHLNLPEVTQVGTLLLNAIDALSHDDQRQLLDWLELAGRRMRVVSTTSAPLFARVQAGAFVEPLYYRLNTICLDLNGPGN